MLKTRYLTQGNNLTTNSSQNCTILFKSKLDSNGNSFKSSLYDRYDLQLVNVVYGYTYVQDGNT